MKRNEYMATRVCPFTLEPVEKCRTRKTVFDGGLCPFSLEACLAEVVTMPMTGTIVARQEVSKGIKTGRRPYTQSSRGIAKPFRVANSADFLSQG